MLEKVLTPSLADWAAGLAHDLIRAVRYEWRYRSGTDQVDGQGNDGLASSESLADDEVMEPGRQFAIA